MPATRCGGGDQCARQPGYEADGGHRRDRRVAHVGVDRLVHRFSGLGGCSRSNLSLAGPKGMTSYPGAAGSPQRSMSPFDIRICRCGRGGSSRRRCRTSSPPCVRRLPGSPLRVTSSWPRALRRVRGRRRPATHD
jgi:hypothetical protein